MKFAEGGLVEGSDPNDDAIPGWLDAGDYIVRCSPSDKRVKEILEKLNEPDE